MSPRLRGFNWLAWVALACGLSVSQLSWRYLQQQVGEDAAFAFEEQCREVHRAVENRLLAYAGLLQGLRALQAAEGRLAGPAGDYLAVLDWQRRFPALQRVQFRIGGVPPHERGSLLPAGLPGQAADDSWLEAPGQGASPGDAGMVVGSLGEAGLLTLGVGIPARAAAQGGTAAAGRVGLVVSLPRLVAEVVPGSVLRRQLRLQISLGAAQAGPLFDSLHQGLPAGLQQGPVGPAAPLLASAARVRIDNQDVVLHFSAVAGSYLRPLMQALPALALVAGVAASLLLFGVLQAMGGAQRQLERAVAQHTRDLQTVNRELREEVQERNRLEQAVFHFNVEERRRFAGELRDGIGQRLGRVLERLQALQLQLAPADALQEQVRALGGHVRTALDQGRLLGLGLRPPVVSRAQFIPSLQQLVAEAGSAFGVPFEFVHDGGPVPGNDMLLHNLYRIVQQAITNSVTHGHARHVRVELHTRAALRLLVTDDGIGWAPAADGAAQGIGLSIMRYRCAVLDLDFRMEAGPQGRGAAIVIEERARSA